MKRALVAAAIGCFMAVQLALPVIGLFEQRPARFGWQMYSISQAAPQAWGVETDGERTALDLAGRLAVLRADTHDAAGIGRALCGESSYQSVQVQFGDARPVEVACK